LVFDRLAIADFAPGRLLRYALATILPPIMVLGLVVLLASIGSQLGFGEGRWVGRNLAPKGSRINPLSGLRRMFGLTGWIEMAKGLAKVALLGAIAWGWGKAHLDVIVGLGRESLHAQLADGWHALLRLFLALAAGLVVIAFVDLPVQWYRRQSRLRMTHREMREEQKETDGSPERKAAIRNRQRTLAMSALAPAMREAQFVITNPAHFAVALVYDPARAAAPILLAKGRGEKALAMRELAAEYEVPVLEYPALARSIYFTTRERQMIRCELYVAVAAVLAFVLSLKRGEHPVRPEVHVPVTLRFDAEGRPDPDNGA
ncbi:MAG: EscU/YscU/HrcU family type III secretion system export apparatus switch protein, partial [Novosphingobium sp.]|nr:EscU/YscU/HrcU family type III secretion system export apparatus switch protein [Novosphingobium sp.]